MGSPNRKHKLIALAVALALVAGSGLAWWLLRGPIDPDDPADPGVTDGPIVRGVPRATMRKVKESLRAELKAAGFKPRAPIYMRIFKASSELEVWVKKGRIFQHFRTYRICTFSGELGPKLRRGDFQAPEGFYSVKRRQLNPHSSYHLSFNVGYPNRFDRAHKRTGSAIMVHGDCVSAGCFAMTNRRIQQIYALAEDALRGGQKAFPIHIFPFRMTDKAMTRHASSRWFDFWRDLKKGYDAFERRKVPPRVTVRKGRYVVG